VGDITIASAGGLGFTRDKRRSVYRSQSIWMDCRQTGLYRAVAVAREMISEDAVDIAS
jgi:hypothetical protein